MTEVIARLEESGAEVAAAAVGSGDVSANAGRWTRVEILEHLILVERAVMGLLRRAMEAPAAEGRREYLSDEEVWERLAGALSRPAAAPGRVVPAGMYSDADVALEELGRLRRETVTYARTTPFDLLRTKWLRLPVGEVDGVQALLMLAGHSVRHAGQLRELASSGS